MANFESTFKVCAHIITAVCICACVSSNENDVSLPFLFADHKSDFCRQGYGLCTVEVCTEKLKE